MSKYNNDDPLENVNYDEYYVGVGGSGDGKTIPKHSFPGLQENDKIIICNIEATLAEEYQRKGDTLVFIKEVPPGIQLIGGPLDGAVINTNKIEKVGEGEHAFIENDNGKFMMYRKEDNKLKYIGNIKEEDLPPEILNPEN